MEGQLVGHITIGIGMVEKKLVGLPDFPENLRVLVEHIILSHHGKYEFGSPKVPMVPEALLLHYLDDLDAKMQTMRSEFARAEAQGRAPGQMTEWVRAMERPLLNTAGYLGEQPVPTEPEIATREPEITNQEPEVASVLPVED
jgi:3'-5' exoribonuclease